MEPSGQNLCCACLPACLSWQCSPSCHSLLLPGKETDRKTHKSPLKRRSLDEPMKSSCACFSCFALSRHRDQVEKWDNGSGVKQHWVNSCVFVNSCQVFEGFSGPAERGSQINVVVWKKGSSSAVPVSCQDVQAKCPLIVCVRKKSRLRLDPAGAKKDLACKVVCLKEEN